MGLVFAFLYVKRSVLSFQLQLMFTMNTLVAVAQVLMSNEQIQEMIKEAEKCKALSEDF